MEKIYFDEFSIFNMEKAETDFRYCPKCKDKNILSMIMLEKEYTKDAKPKGELAFCKKCDNTILIIYDRSKEKLILEMAKIIKDKLT